MAGCAGLGAVVPALLGLSCGEKPSLPELDPRLLVLCGSVNPVTLAQLSEAEHSGFVRLRLRPDQKLMEGYFDTPEGEAYLAAWKKKLAQYDAVIGCTRFVISKSGGFGKRTLLCDIKKQIEGR